MYVFCCSATHYVAQKGYYIAFVATEVGTPSLFYVGSGVGSLACLYGQYVVAMGLWRVLGESPTCEERWHECCGASSKGVCMQVLVELCTRRLHSGFTLSCRAVTMCRL